jgi:hypothetical protein
MCKFAVSRIKFIKSVNSITDSFDISIFNFRKGVTTTDGYLVFPAIKLSLKAK